MSLRRLVLLIFAIATGAIVALGAAPKVSTRRPVAKTQARSAAAVSAAAPTADFDTLRIAPADTLCPVRAAGYDKPLNSSYETLHLTNLSDSLTILAVGLRLVYLDLEGRTLHSRRAEVRATLPPQQTRLGRIRSWDAQKSFYYVGGRQPRTDRVTPYDIALTVEYVVVEKKKRSETVDN